MKDLWQSVCKKTELKDLTLRDVILRELKEKMDLVTIWEDLQYLFNDINFDYNIYKLKVHLRTKLDQIELVKYEPWKYFNWGIYARLVREKWLIPTHISYRKQIFWSFASKKTT